MGFCVAMTMKGSGKKPEDWLEWHPPTVLKVPQEGFNTYHRSNAAFLADWREYDGYFYLLYAGTTEGKTHAGRGNNKLGLARSQDLKTWSAPSNVSVEANKPDAGDGK